MRGKLLVLRGGTGDVEFDNRVQGTGTRDEGGGARVRVRGTRMERTFHSDGRVGGMGAGFLSLGVEPGAAAGRSVVSRAEMTNRRSLRESAATGAAVSGELRARRVRLFSFFYPKFRIPNSAEKPANFFGVGWVCKWLVIRASYLRLAPRLLTISEANPQSSAENTSALSNLAESNYRTHDSPSFPVAAH